MGRLKHLQELLLSLNQAEKRYLSLHAEELLTGDGQAATLYNILQAHSSDPEEQVRMACTAAGLGHNLPTLVTRLRQSVVDILCLQHGGKTVDSQLHSAMGEIAWLAGKKLWDQAGWKIRKAKKLARTYSKLLEFKQLLAWEQRLILDIFPKNSRTEILRIREEELRVEAQLRLQSSLRHLEYLARDLVRRHLESGSAESSRFLEEINTNPDVKAGLISDDFLSYSYAVNTRGTLALSNENYEAAREIYGQLFKAWVSRPKWMAEYSERFIALFNNYQITLLHTDNGLPALHEATDILRRVRIQSPAARLALEHTFFQSRLIVLMNTGQIKEGAELAAEIMQWLKMSGRNLSANVHLMYLYNSTLIFFLQEDFRAALRSIRRIADQPVKKARRDIREFSRLLQLFLLYELEEWGLLEAELASTYQYFIRNGITGFQRGNISLLRALLNSGAKEKQTELLENHARFLEGLRSEDAKHAFGRTELQIWTQARVSGTSLAKVFKDMLPPT